jgi:hypothetical protein
MRPPTSASILQSRSASVTAGCHPRHPIASLPAGGGNSLLCSFPCTSWCGARQSGCPQSGLTCPAASRAEQWCVDWAPQAAGFLKNRGQPRQLCPRTTTTPHPLPRVSLQCLLLLRPGRCPPWAVGSTPRLRDCSPRVCRWMKYRRLESTTRRFSPAALPRQTTATPPDNHMGAQGQRPETSWTLGA